MRLPQRTGGRLDRLVVVFTGVHSKGTYVPRRAPRNSFCAGGLWFTPPSPGLGNLSAARFVLPVSAVNSSPHRMPLLRAGERTWYERTRPAAIRRAQEDTDL